MFLQESFQRSCTVDQVIHVLYDKVLCCRCKFYSNLAVFQTFVLLIQQQMNDISDVILGQRLEHDDLIQTV